MKFLYLLAASLISTAPDALANQFDMGPLSQIIQPRSDSSWIVSSDRGAVRIENPSDEGAITYFYVRPRESDQGRREISLDINLERFHQNSYAGILYGFLENPKSYYLFTLNGDKSVSLHFMDKGNFRQLTKLQNDAIKTQKTTLALRESGNQLALIVNGTKLSSFGNNRIGRGSVGIVAGNTGIYRFSNFDVRVPANTIAAADGRAANNTLVASEDTQRVTDRVLKEIRNAQSGFTVAKLPVPSGWNFQHAPNSEHLLAGPDGLLIHTARLDSYAQPHNQMAAQAFQQAGLKLSPVLPLKQYLQEYIAPIVAQLGLQLIESYPLPQAVDYWKKLAVGTPHTAFSYNAIGSEWQMPNGKKAFISVTQSVLPQAMATLWNMTSVMLEVKEAEFEAAKDAYLYAISNIEFNPEWKQHETQKFLQKRGQMQNYWANVQRQRTMAHQARMRSIDARGASRSSIAKTYSDILDINHAGHLNRSSMVDAGQQSTVNAISGHNIISNTNTGERYRVESGSKYYWVNNSGEYFGTDNTFYDPRMDNKLNNQQWSPFAIQQ